MEHFPMNVFDEDAEIADQATAERMATLAAAGLTLAEFRGFERLTGWVS